MRSYCLVHAPSPPRRPSTLLFPFPPRLQFNPTSAAQTLPLHPVFPTQVTLSEHGIASACGAMAAFLAAGGDAAGKALGRMAKRPVLGHSVASLLDVASRKALGREARVAALDALACLLRSVGQSRRRALAFFLPGVLSALTKLATAEQRTGSKLIHAALEAWALTAVLVLGRRAGSDKSAASPEQQLRNLLIRAQREETQRAANATAQGSTPGGDGDGGGDGDSDGGDDDDNDLISSDSDSDSENERGQAASAPGNTAGDARLNVTRSRAWWRNAEENSIGLLRQLLRVLPAHESPRARASVARLCGALLAFCSQTLPSAIPHALDTLALLSMDGLAEVRAAAVVSLTQLHRPSGAGEEGTGTDHLWRAKAAQRQLVARLLPVVQQRLLELPRVCRRGTDDELLLALRRLEAAFALLGPAAGQLLDDPETGPRLCAGLVEVLQLDMNAFHFMVGEDAGGSAVSTEDADLAQGLRRVYIHFRDQRIERSALRLCFVWTQLERTQGAARGGGRQDSAAGKTAQQGRQRSREDNTAGASAPLSSSFSLLPSHPYPPTPAPRACCPLKAETRAT